MDAPKTDVNPKVARAIKSAGYIITNSFSRVEYFPATVLQVANIDRAAGTTLCNERIHARLICRIREEIFQIFAFHSAEAYLSRVLDSRRFRRSEYCKIIDHAPAIAGRREERCECCDGLLRILHFATRSLSAAPPRITYFVLSVFGYFAPGVSAPLSVRRSRSDNSIQISRRWSLTR